RRRGHRRLAAVARRGRHLVAARAAVVPAHRRIGPCRRVGPAAWMSASHRHDVVVIGAGIVGAACCYYLARAGLKVAVIETGAGEGNILVSDKEPGPELELAQLSVRLWRRLGDELGPDAELEPKGGLVVAAGPEERRQLDDFAAAQAAAGVKVRTVGHAGLR